MNEFCDLLAVADEGERVRGEMPYDACLIHDCWGGGRECLVKDVVNCLFQGASCSIVEDLRQLCSEFRRFCGVTGECFGLVVQTCVADGGEELLGLCQ